MKILHKTLLITASLILVAGAGCNQSTTTNTNPVVNANSSTVVVGNTNIEQVNESINVDEVVKNTNSDNDNINAKVADTLDWLTYENMHMGVRFKYPSEWMLDEYYENDSWEKKSDEASAWVRFIAPNGEKLIISRSRNEAIKVEINEPTEIAYTEVEYSVIDGYNAAQIKSINKFVSSEIIVETWVEIGNDLIRMPDINEFPELEQVIASFEIINE